MINAALLLRLPIYTNVRVELCNDLDYISYKPIFRFKIKVLDLPVSSFAAGLQLGTAELGLGESGRRESERRRRSRYERRYRRRRSLIRVGEGRWRRRR